MFSKTTKLMLRNVIQHTGIHNRIVEETDMWNQREASKQREERSARKSFLFDQRSDYYDDRRRRQERSAHMDSDSDGNDRNERLTKSTYWARQLQKAEENDADRWGHSGFKELYPEDFDTDHSDRVQAKLSSKKLKKHKKKKKKKKEHFSSESESEQESFSRKSGMFSKITREDGDLRVCDKHGHRDRVKLKRKNSDLSDSSSKSHRKKKRRKHKHKLTENKDRLRDERMLKKKKHKRKH